MPQTKMAEDQKTTKPVENAGKTRIIRVFFKFGNDEFAIDRAYGEDLSEQENCDRALQVMIESMHSGTVVPALRLISKKETTTERVFINLGNVAFITILNVVVYMPEQKA